MSEQQKSLVGEDNYSRLISFLKSIKNFNTEIDFCMEEGVFWLEYNAKNYASRFGAISALLSFIGRLKRQKGVELLELETGDRCEKVLLRGDVYHASAKIILSCTN